MAIDFDPTRTWKGIEEKLATTTNPRHRRMLEEVLAHAKGEVAGDLEGVLATLAPDPVYRYMPDYPAEGPNGIDGVRDFYVNHIFGGGRHIIEANDDRVIVDDSTVITEGTMRILQWGPDLVARGITMDDPDATYLMAVRLLIVWPFDKNCKILGEESWSQPVQSLEKIADEDVPQIFREYIESKLAAV
jgi:hypothetical protein